MRHSRPLFSSTALRPSNPYVIFMAAKTSNGNHRDRVGYHAVETDDSLLPSGGASAEADRRLGLTETTQVVFYKTGEHRNPKKGDLMATHDGYVYIATWDSDEPVDIVEVRRAPKPEVGNDPPAA